MNNSNIQDELTPVKYSESQIEKLLLKWSDAYYNSESLVSARSRFSIELE